MDAAKEVGATGGTVVHARGLGSHEATKFLGISIHEDKELVLIIAKKENKKSIMENICKATGLSSPGKGITFSLPVDEQMGLV
jgi:nitrogen regulatory protein PII